MALTYSVILAATGTVAVVPAHLLGLLALPLVATLALGLLMLRPRRGQAENAVLTDLFPADRIADLGRADVVIALRQNGPRLRIVMVIHHRRNVLEYVRLGLAVSRGRRFLGARPATLSADLPPGAVVLVRQDLVLRAMNRPRRLCVGLASAPHFTETRNGGRQRRSYWAAIDRLRVGWARWRWGAAAEAEATVAPMAAGELLDPLDHRPDWAVCTLWSPGDAREPEEMKQAIARAMDG